MKILVLYRQQSPYVYTHIIRRHQEKYSLTVEEKKKNEKGFTQV